jgi:hypothetical protein
MPFRKGQSGNPAGRRRGRCNNKTLEWRSSCQRLLDDPAYREKLKPRLNAGELPSALERELWLTAYPPEPSGGGGVVMNLIGFQRYDRPPAVSVQALPARIALPEGSDD